MAETQTPLDQIMQSYMNYGQYSESELAELKKITSQKNLLEKQVGGKEKRVLFQTSFKQT